MGDAERELIVSQRRVSTVAVKEDDAAQYGRHKIPWLQIFSSKAVLAITLSYFAFGYVAWMFYTWFYIYMAQVRGLNLKTSALYSMLPFLAMTAGCLLGGVLSDWIVTHYGAAPGRCLLPASLSRLPPCSWCWVRGPRARRRLRLCWPSERASSSSHRASTGRSPPTSAESMLA